MPLFQKVGRLAIICAEAYARTVGNGEPGNQSEEIVCIGGLPDEHDHAQAQFFPHFFDGGGLMI